LWKHFYIECALPLQDTDEVHCPDSNFRHKSASMDWKPILLNCIALLRQVPDPSPRYRVVGRYEHQFKFQIRTNLIQLFFNCIELYTHPPFSRYDTNGVLTTSLISILSRNWLQRLIVHSLSRQVSISSQDANEICEDTSTLPPPNSNLMIPIGCISFEFDFIGFFSSKACPPSWNTGYISCC